MKLPSWAVPDEIAIELAPEKGWIRDCLEYGVWASDAPTILHLGAAMTALCVAASNATIVVEGIGGRSERPFVLWSLLIAPSGSRKSTAAKLPMDLLTRATATAEGWKAVVIPSDGSIEGWTEFLIKHNNAIMYRTEFSSVLSQAARSYTAGLKAWLLELYECQDNYRRETKNEGEKIVARPRVSILGPIPPKIFASGVEHNDWSSGFLARMTYWCGVRSRRNPIDLRDAQRSTKLALWLQNVACRFRGQVKIPEDLMWRVDSWVVKHIETDRSKVNEDVFSHLDRYQSQIYVFAALFALSRRVVAQTQEDGQILVDQADIELALSLAMVLKKSTMSFFLGAQAHTAQNNLTQKAECIHEGAILTALTAPPDPKGMKVTEIQADLQEQGYQLSRASIFRVLKALRDSGDIILRKSGTRSYYSLATW